MFEKEPAKENPLFEFETVVVTPHLGADTYEAQKRVVETIAEQVLKALRGEIVPNVVNLPAMVREELNLLQPYILLAEKLGNIYYQIAKTPVERLELTYSGPIAEHEIEMLTISFLKGLLGPVIEQVNYVNAKIMASDRGIKIFEKQEGQGSKHYTNLITAQVFSKTESVEVAGTISQTMVPILTEIDGYEMESELDGYVLLVKHEDRPRVIGPFATKLGDYGVNIAGMKVARKKKGDISMMLINVDNKVEEDVLSMLTNSEGIQEAPILLHF